jgi:ornithine cyclodeaminase
MEVISSERVEALVDFPELIEALREGFRQGAAQPPRMRHEVDGSDGASLFVMPAWREGVGRVVKLMSAVPSNAARGLRTSSEVLNVFDPATGELRAVIESTSLTNMRTAAASALAAGYLARPDAATLALFATGPLAPYMARAHAAVRHYRRVVVWGRALARAEATAAALGRHLAGVEVVATDDAGRAAGEADVICTATRATEPILLGRWLKPGTHVDLVGGYKKDMRESDDMVVADARIFVDQYEAALRDPGDIVQPLAAGVIAREAILADLADLVAGRHPGRTDAISTTVFKSVGCGLEDLYAARLVLDRLAVGGQGKN